MRLATIFSGIGSPEMAIKRVYDNVETVFACEIDKFARKTYLANHKIDKEHFHKDIYNLDGTQYREKVDILVGGSPCQDFSIAGLRKGIKGKRGELIYEFIRIVDEVKPSIFIYENVEGFTQGKMQKSFKEFQEALRNIGYYIHSDILNTKDYGVPQNRPRLYIVGALSNIEEFHFPESFETTKTIKDFLDDSVNEKFYYNNKPLYERIKDDIKRDDTMYQWRRHYVRENKNNLCPTLTANMGTGGHNVPIIKDKKGIRKLTPRECLRLQDFPDTFKIVCSDSQTYKQAGNAMSCNVLEMIFRQLKEPKEIARELINYYYSKVGRSKI